MFKWQQAYRTTDGLLVGGGFMDIRRMDGFDPVVHAVVEFDAAPPVEHTHYDSGRKITRLPTEQEALTIDTARADRDADGAMDAKAIKAAVLTSLWGRLGRQPTAQEISAERARFVSIYKAL